MDIAWSFGKEHCVAAFFYCSFLYLILEVSGVFCLDFEHTVKRQSPTDRWYKWLWFSLLLFFFFFFFNLHISFNFFSSLRQLLFCFEIVMFSLGWKPKTQKTKRYLFYWVFFTFFFFFFEAISQFCIFLACEYCCSFPSQRERDKYRVSCLILICKDIMDCI